MALYGEIHRTRDGGRSDVMTIDVARVIRERLPRHARYLPPFLFRWIERLICQEGLNDLLRSNAGREGADFCSGVLSDLDVSYRLIDGGNMPAADDRKVVYVSNHPLGALDGIALIDMVARHHGVEPKFVVNDLLMAVRPLNSVFVPINKFGSQSRHATDALNQAFAGDAPVIVFPAGLVSRKSKNGGVADLRWKKMVINKAIESGRDIIPLFFGGRNSSFFYNFAKFRASTGVKFNIEMALLPGEIFKCRGKRFPIAVGRRVMSRELSGGRSAESEIADLRRLVYDLESLIV